MTACRVEGCHVAGKMRRGLCHGHYRRLMRNGSPTGGSTSTGEAAAFYQNVVKAYDGNECLMWPYAVTWNGYAQIKIDGKTSRVSRLVCEEIHGAPPSVGSHAAHSCGNGQVGCVARSHISWKSPKGNAIDTTRMGRRGLGLRGGRPNFGDTGEDLY